MQRITLEIVIRAMFGVGAGAERERLRTALEGLLRLDHAAHRGSRCSPCSARGTSTGCPSTGG